MLIDNTIPDYEFIKNVIWAQAWPEFYTLKRNVPPVQKRNYTKVPTIQEDDWYVIYVTRPQWLP